jgi:tubulin-specific chaperone A
MASAETPTQKQCRVKTAVVARTKKELDAYKLDIELQRQKVETMRAEGKDEFDIRQQQGVFDETERVIPDTMRRLQAAIDDLAEFVVSVSF